MIRLFILAKMKLFIGAFVLFCISVIQINSTIFITPSLNYSKICSLAPETGIGDAYFERFHYDKASGTCKMFVYGGVGGNKNNFKTPEECMEKCEGK